jgi:hypothetical protein
VHGEDPCRARGDQLLDPLRVDVVRPRVDVAEDGRDLLPLQGVRRRHERERRHDDLAGQPRRTDGDLERHRPVAHGDAVRDAQPGGDGRLELLHERPVVRQPAPVQGVADAAQQALTVADVGTAHVERLAEERVRAEDREPAHRTARSRSGAR